MIDLTPYLKPTVQQNTGPLHLSDMAAEEMAMILRGHGQDQIAEPEKFGPVVADTVSQFLTAGYHARSDWFRRQRVHSVCSFAIGDLPSPIFHLEKGEHGGHVVRSVDEIPLPESYYEERVVEEVRVEMGLT